MEEGAQPTTWRLEQTRKPLGSCSCLRRPASSLLCRRPRTRPSSQGCHFKSHSHFFKLPYPTLPYPTLPYPTPPALPSPTLPYPTLPYPTLPYPTLPYPTLPYPTLPQPTETILARMYGAKQGLQRARGSCVAAQSTCVSRHQAHKLGAPHSPTYKQRTNNKDLGQRRFCKRQIRP